MLTAPLEHPRRIGGFDVRGPLGSGAMGIVYRAHDPRLDREVAIKILLRAADASTDARLRFRREARAVAALSHPNVLTVFDVGEHDGAPYIVTELLDGETLRARLDRGPISVREAVDIARQAAEGLAAAHAAGLLHRDIKPDNLFLTAEGRLKVLDFGLAKSILEDPAGSEAGHLTSPGAHVGTPLYMSPEQVRGEPLDPRSDIFSLGTVLFECLAGRPAFVGKGAAIMAAILEHEPPSLSRIAPDVPRLLADVVARALEKRREERYQTADDLVADLRRVARRLDRAPFPTPRWPRRWRRAAALTGCAALVVALPALGYFAAQRREAGTPRVGWTRPITPLLGNVNAPIVTDGSRVYFTVDDGVTASIYQSPVTGGAAPVRIETQFTSTRVFDIARDRAELLVGGLDRGIGVEDFPLWVQPTTGGSARRLGDLVANGASWSPDGTHIAYTHEDTLAVADADGSRWRPLFKFKGFPMAPRWSPDGRHIRCPVIAANRSHLWDVDVAAGTATPLFDPLFKGNENDGAWTSDGRYFLFSADRDGRTRLWAIPGGASAGLSSAAARPLTAGPVVVYGAIDIGPEPGWLAIGEELEGEVVRYEAGAGRFMPFLPGISAFSITYSPDRQSIAYVTYPDHALWRARADGTDRRQLSSPPTRAIDVAWTPDGQTIVFAGLTEAQAWASLYRVPAAGGSVEPLLPSGTRARCPVVLPDGSIVYYRWTTGFSDGELRHLDPRTRRDVPFQGGKNFSRPIAPPSGQWIAALDSERHPHLYDTRTGRWASLGDMQVTHWAPDPNDDAILLDTTHDGKREILKLRLADRALSHVASLDGERRFTMYYGSWFGVTPDGAPIILRPISGQRLYKLELER